MQCIPSSANIEVNWEGFLCVAKPFMLPSGMRSTASTEHDALPFHLYHNVMACLILLVSCTIRSACMSRLSTNVPLESPISIRTTRGATNYVSIYYLGRSLGALQVADAYQSQRQLV